MILFHDTIKRLVDDTHYTTKYRATCDKCGCDRGYLDKQRAQKPYCRKCSPRSTEESRQKMSIAKQGKLPWNKGKKEVRNAVLNKMSVSRSGQIPVNKGKKMSFEQKVKLSCNARGINLSDFDELKTPTSRIERNRFAELGLHIQRFELDQYTCQACGISKTSLNAHHKNSWKYFEDQRFSVENLISLCTHCHKEFHSIYGNGKTTPNTEEQMNSFLKNKKQLMTRKTIILVAGVSGAGKSWVCNQVKDSVSYILYDKTDKRNVRAIMWNDKADLILYDPTTHVSSFITRNQDIFDIKLLVIQEDEATIKARLQGRGGQITDSVKRRIKRMKTLAKRSLFTGTSSEVLSFLQNEILLNAKIVVA